LNIQARDILQEMKPYSPGKPIWEVQEEYGLTEVTKLASNENPLGPSPKAVKAVWDAIGEIHRYPDSQAVRLKTAIAKHHQVDPRQIIIGNGADELITLLSETFLQPGDEILVPLPSFGEYVFGAKLMGAQVRQIPLTEDFDYDLERFLTAVRPQTKLVYLCSPHNPTGTYIEQRKLTDFLNRLPGNVLTVLDGAYSHYANTADFDDGMEHLRDGSPLLVLRTFSKIYGLAGLRVGYAVSAPEIISRILQVKEPFNVNSLAQAAAAAALEDEDHIHLTRQVNADGRQQLYRAFDRLGIRYTKSMSNFILIEAGGMADTLYESLLGSGIIVRRGATWGLPGHLRISVGTTEENVALLSQLEKLWSQLRAAE
jgi:histidinol-phosphate aminotransferase